MAVPLTGLPQRARNALVGAVLLAVALTAGGLTVFHSGLVSHVDIAAYWAFTGIAKSHTRLASLALHLASSCDASHYVVLVAIPFLIALLRGRLAVAVAVIVICVGATQTTELLKPLLSGARPGGGLPVPSVARGSWPSGHATAAMALALSCVIAVPRRGRPYAAAVGGAFALGVAYSVLMLGWHYPSDALAGMGMAAFWTLLAVAGVSLADARWGRETVRWHPLQRSLHATTEHHLIRRGHLPSTAAVLGAAAIPAVALLLLRAGDAFSYADDHASFVAVVFALASVAVLSTGAVLAAIRR